MSMLSLKYLKLERHNQIIGGEKEALFSPGVSGLGRSSKQGWESASPTSGKEDELIHLAHGTYHQQSPFWKRRPALSFAIAGREIELCKS